MTGICKSFPGVRALWNAQLELGEGEVLALLGENGAGKSTLVKVLAGAHQPDAGDIFLRGEKVEFRTPAEAIRAGIAVIYQELNLVPSLSARENIWLGREQTQFVRRRFEQRQVLELFRKLGVQIDSEVPCRFLTVAQQQVVEIAKALSQRARIIVMDEPSAALTLQEVDRLFGMIRDLKREGISIIYISHRLEEIFAIADRVTVMRDGQHIATQPARDVTRERLIELMVGRRIDSEFPKRNVTLGEERLVVADLSRGEHVRHVSFSIRRGEVLGLTGLIGSGRTETARLIFGADRRDSGTIFLDGRQLEIRNPRDAIRAGIGLLTEDRKAQGLVLGQSVRHNFALPNLKQFSWAGFVRQRLERGAFQRFVSALRIRMSDEDGPARNLSGGNQQKLVLAKWLQRNCEVIIFDEPTRGIDVGAKYEVYLLINELAAQGKAVLMISSELPEVLGMCDRILVMHDGRVTGEIREVSTATQEQIMKLAIR